MFSLQFGPQKNEPKLVWSNHVAKKKYDFQQIYIKNKQFLKTFNIIRAPRKFYYRFCNKITISTFLFFDYFSNVFIIVPLSFRHIGQ